MSLNLYDTMARAKRPFVPADPKRVTMYVCGPTVYNYAHIGNARPVVVFDVLFRLLRHAYGDEAVLYAANVTDVDDKINAKAQAEGVAIDVITERYIEIYNRDMATLGALRPTFQPRATQTMDAIQAMIATLVQKGGAYAAEGHVLFDTQAYPDYGKLSGRSLEDLIAGARVDVAPYKRHPADFVLWKPSKPGEPVWESPWGPGRPGWHIECSAMIEQALGLPIDIHGGGNDLIFPHHENELAQGVCAAHGCEGGHTGDYARYWLHNGFLNFGSEKMSKSLGNVVLVHDLVKQAPGEAVRWALLVGHYRAPLEWSGELIEQARKSLDRLYGALRRAADVTPSTDAPAPKFLAALEDDLNTAQAMAELFALASALETGSPEEKARAKGELLASGRLMGFLQSDPEAWFQGGADEDLKTRVEALIAARIEARSAKDWPRADAIRDELNALNVEVMDSATGATWRLKEPS
ncbi:MAG: cysteine--tRNA ligase [Phenylobacterium sp.]|uniref:cysteine--tRNA ligase n=1 Tax=Phenylobacterium sp. TaxID=1871053 RepID=UPI0017C2D1B9|nr:cysteine--tRNA ligase [Phenylobacterium sp.]MBA4794294.1 cysteine--tRNA ligase [Phenylobacterium sp.]